EAYLVTNLLEGVIDRGTGQSARGLGARGALAGKTGTTDDYRDAWFVGFSPVRVAGVWVGFDRGGRVGLSGSRAALPIWAALMRAVQPPGGDGAFTRPPRIVEARIDPQSGQLAGSRCPETVDEVFLSGTEPKDECGLHRDGFFARLKRFFSF
ncbi:MAG: transpeptidase-transglycosylase, partial [Candidatus Eisenbacteria bacterium]|nr:transpeptidase-transglycosylase [Candidatus Eisenbacteria bacterium]